MSINEIIVVLITSFFILYTLMPIFFRKKAGGKKADSDYSELLGKQEIMQSNLADLIFDYQMGKLADEDYNAMQIEYSDEIKKISQEIKDKPKEIRSDKKLINYKVCGKCGYKISAKSRFCSNCGTKIGL